MLAPDKPVLTAEFVNWLRAHADVLFLSAITIAELEQGICKLRRIGATDRAARLTAWLDSLLAGATDRVLPFDSNVGRVAGALSDEAIAVGRHPGFPDIAIAATANTRDLTLLTRNGKHFELLRVRHLDPFEALPPTS